MGLSGGYGAIPYGDDVGGDLPPPEYDPTGIQGYQQAGSKNTDVEAGTSSWARDSFNANRSLADTKTIKHP